MELPVLSNLSYASMALCQSSGGTEGIAIVARLLMAHMAMTGKRLVGAIVLVRLDPDLL